MVFRSGRCRRFWLGLSCVFALSVLPARAQTDDGQKVYQRTLKSTVWILAKKGSRIAMGTGSLIDKTHSRVITNYHVAGEAQSLVVVFAEFSGGKPISERSHYWNKLRNGSAIGAKLLEVDPQASRIVELRFFGGLSNEESSQVLGISPETVQRRWVGARAWLAHAMSRR